jgi:uncharacterized protein YcbX
MPVVSRIHIHPLKGFAPVAVVEATVLPSGALAFDRRWAFVDERDRYINGKNVQAIHAVPVTFDLPHREVSFDGRAYSLRDAGALEHAMSQALGQRVALRENVDAGHPDDLESPGPTCVSAASVAAVAGWFGRDVDETRLRFRTNIEWDEGDAFWEDRLYGRRFVMGRTSWLAVNPCQRCVVPSRHPATGVAIEGFQRRFAEARERALPPEADRDRFSHFYRFAVNTRLVSGADTVIRVGDPVRE